MRGAEPEAGQGFSIVLCETGSKHTRRFRQSVAGTLQASRSRMLSFGE
jgi:hypothetical protein